MASLDRRSLSAIPYSDRDSRWLSPLPQQMHHEQKVSQTLEMYACDTHTHTHICYREFFFCLLLINWHFIKPRTVSKNHKFQLKQIKNTRSTQTTGTALGHVFSTPILVTVFTSLESCLLFKMLLLIGHPYLNHFSPLSKTISPSFKPEHVTSQQNLPPSQLLV